ncbi:MAG TPA: adenylosuccinate lyase, partial [candidate division Zixibacteria bacterium]|nr:adenylosuccinate lyase [candidate division Zixibacteria bacterium]
MISRYTRPKMGRIWSDDNRYKKWLQVELAVCEAMAQLGIIPQEDYDIIASKAKFKLSDIRKEEEKTHHEVVAFLNVLQNNVGEEAARWIHFGLTSSDIMDTGLALQIKDAGAIIEEDIQNLLNAIEKLATKHRYTPIIGRTHGVHAEPTTLGLKFAAWYDEMRRNYDNFKYALEQAIVGKIAGAVGNFANVEPEVERIALEKLGVKPEPA